MQKVMMEAIVRGTPRARPHTHTHLYQHTKAHTNTRTRVSEYGLIYSYSYPHHAEDDDGNDCAWDPGCGKNYTAAAGEAGQGSMRAKEIYWYNNNLNINNNNNCKINIYLEN